MNYQVQLSDISPDFDECPIICFRNEQKDKRNFCDNCEIKVAKDIFFEYTKEDLNTRIGDSWEQYTFEGILDTVQQVIAIEDDDHTQWSPVTEVLFDIYMSQRNRLQRIDNWNFKQKIKNKGGD